MIEDLQIRNYSPRTVQIYVDRVAKFARYFGKSPDRLGPAHVRQFQVFLVETRKVSWSLFNQTVCALRFFYRVCLGRPWMVEQIPFPKQEKRLPVVLSRQEIARLFAAVDNLKHRTILMTLYATGLRPLRGPVPAGLGHRQRPNAHPSSWRERQKRPLRTPFRDASGAVTLLLETLPSRQLAFSLHRSGPSPGHQLGAKSVLQGH